MSILAPMVAMVGLTFAVLLAIPYARFKAAREGRVSGRDFLYGESANVPPEVRLPNRNLINLLEMPLLFYVACLTLYVTRSADEVAVAMAWLYFALRAVHSLIHLSYNRVGHRLAAFAASNVVLLAMWLRLFFVLARA